MSENQELKGQLPFPYDQDLGKVLTHLDRRTPFSRERLANDPVTAAYLAAAMRLVARHLGPEPTRTPRDPRDGNSLDRPLLSFLTQRSIAAEVANNPDPFPRQGNVSTMRSRWKSQSDFIADLINFAMWQGNDPVDSYDQVVAGTERLLEGPNMVDAVHDLAYLNVRDAACLPAFRLGFAAMTSAEGDEVIGEAVSSSYAGFLEPWKEVYAALLEARHLQLRPGITLDDIANLLAATVDGLALRSIGDPSSDLIDHERRRSLLGTMALAVIQSCLEPSEGADGMTLEDAVRMKVYGHTETDSTSELSRTAPHPG
ncbi:hypothetical protein [Streptomyces microflavus]|uniref:hypothetical protein n=1 Tax=Streptomyces microflavus TaxID=1919 RepID=UPI0038661C6F|nr:TetR family transcriptional regulator C-terminal domain-containing protein [Streptomyces microflavus]